MGDQQEKLSSPQLWDRRGDKNVHKNIPTFCSNTNKEQLRVKSPYPEPTTAKQKILRVTGRQQENWHTAITERSQAPRSWAQFMAVHTTEQGPQVGEDMLQEQTRRIFKAVRGRDLQSEKQQKDKGFAIPTDIRLHFKKSTCL